MTELYHADQTHQIQHKRLKPFPPARDGFKYCLDCEQEKPLNEFHKMKGASDGYRPICKDCRKVRDKQPKVIVQRPLFVFSKMCSECKEGKDIEQFNKMKSTKDGYHVVCRKCQSEYNHQHRIDNLDDYKARAHIKNVSSRTKARKAEKHRERSTTDPQYIETRKTRRQRYYRGHKTQAKEYTLRRRARILNTTTEKVDFDCILERDGYFCYICEKPIDPNAVPRSYGSLAFDHFIPLQPRPDEPQGTHTSDNIRPAHSICNLRKSNKPFSLLTAFERQGP